MLRSKSSWTRRLSSLALKPGDKLHGFKVLRKEPIPEYSVTAIELEHVRTKASYLHIDTVDTNNVFSINFRTPPYSSNGIAHVLEHLVLCGSKQYPVRDPFFNMLKRSLNNFMNAMTACDHTMYPFATTNPADFRNLMQVYLDATFFPRLRHLDFLQEGHRLELDNDKLIYKGVVFNEMKGVMSDSDTLFATRMQQQVMPSDSIYAHVSGGDPSVIPSLTYQELLDFHKTHYHPSNCLFYSYGTFPLTEHLEYLENKVLVNFEPSKAATIPTIKNVKKSDGIVYLEGPDDGVSGDAAAQTKWCQSHVVPNVLSTDIYTCLVLRIISFLLINGPSAPLYKALILSELAIDFSTGTGVDTSSLNPTFGLGVEGFDKANVPEIQATILRVLDEVDCDGFEQERIDAMLHQIELGQKHIVGKFGMSLLRGAVSSWCHRGDMLSSLGINPYLERLQKDMQNNPRFLQDMMQKYITTPMKSSASVQVVMEPSVDFVQKIVASEEAKLAEKLSLMTPADLEKIQAITVDLQAHQNQVPDVDCLPTLTINDIPKIHPKLDTKQAGPKLQFIPQATNELSYFRFKFDTATLPAELKPFLPFFASIMGQLGTSTLSFHDLATKLQSISGGISAATLLTPDLHSTENHTESLMVETLCLPHKVDATLDCLVSIFTDTQFTSPENIQQLKTLLTSAASAASASVASSGHILAATRAQYGLTSVSIPTEQQQGLTAIDAIQAWLKTTEDDPSALVAFGAALSAIASHCFQAKNVQMSVVTEPHLMNTVENALNASFISKLPTNNGPSQASSPFDLTPLPSRTPDMFLGFPLSVNFNVQTIATVPIFHTDHVPLTMLAQVLSSCFLHQQVREKGGAYGCGASQGEGYFQMSSYYDPHTLQTLEAYQRAADFAAGGKFTTRDVDEALMSIFSSIDAPQAPSAKGKGLFTRGFTHEMLQSRREQLLATTKDELVDVAQKYLVAPKQTQRVIVGKDEGRETLKNAGFTCN
ncbi:metalloprotease family M16C [Thraustotheca clavata]|uniref:Metalloprotease family M16C n=1 Tax=Thraustotheca clavata TaxID=74557 RepID=A0A1V9ZCJ1_9STRA|nr:metalloprotease family M16C [Thraustotheca clavata]